MTRSRLYNEGTMEDDRNYIAELLDGEYDEWNKLTHEQQQLMVCEVETRMIEDGLHASAAIRELEHFYIKGKLLEYVKVIEARSAPNEELVQAFLMDLKHGSDFVEVYQACINQSTKDALEEANRRYKREVK